MSLQTTLKELCAINGVSGNEDAVRAYIENIAKDYCDTMMTDNLGNLICTKKGKVTPANKIVLSAHMDEVGFVVTHIEDDGMLRFANVGGIMPAVAGARPVVIGENAVPGVIGMKAIHLLSSDEKEKFTPLDEMAIDIGAKDKEDAQKLVSLGDPIYFYNEYREMGSDMFCVKAIDDRAGCAMMLEMLKTELPCDCSFAFTVQEESGCTGAKTAGNIVDADIAIAVEGTTAGDLAGAAGCKRVCGIGDGPVISHMDKGTIYDHKLFKQAIAIAEAHDIKWQTKAGIFGGNESRSFQVAGTGARVLAVSVPVRYIHSATSVASWGDVENTYKLLTHLLEDLAK